jgi:hypothetical protein
MQMVYFTRVQGSKVRGSEVGRASVPAVQRSARRPTLLDFSSVICHLTSVICLLLYNL